MTLCAAKNVGYRESAIVDPVQGATLPLRLFYPTRAEEQPVRFGPYTLAAAVNAPISAPARASGSGLTLVAISHGNGGTGLVYRDLAVHLARAGFVVALPDHPGNRLNDNALAGTAANLENRPRHLREVLDAAFVDPVVGPHLAPAQAALVGHSMGGYTALALAGGRPSALAAETADGRAHPVAVVPDARVRALVLLAPATVWFAAEGALLGVAAPVLLYTAEHDPFTLPLHAAIVERGLPPSTPFEHRVVQGGGHFAFLSPFPPPRTRPDFPPSQDPPGFDRAAFQPVLAAAVATFLRVHCAEGARSVS